jgi:hypothetical protein
VATSAANQPTGTAARRSTRLERTIPITVMGVDAWRGPYTESVSTVNVSAHGCKYESAHQVLNDSLVILELKGETERASRSARGRVKYVKRPVSNGQLFQTAIELEDPGNVWGVDDPPKDWLPFCGPKSVELDTSRPKPFALPRPETEPAAAEDKNGKGVRPREGERTSPPSSATNPVAQIAGGFQQQFERMLSDAAVIAVRDRAKFAFDELRASLREEAKRIVAETARTNADLAVEKSIKQLKVVAESVQALHVQRSKQMEVELQQACDKIQSRGREIDEVSQALSASALDKLQRAMEASRRESVDRIIARLKEQSTPLLEQAQKVMAELNRCAQDISPVVERSLEETTARIKQTHAQLEKQFEKGIRERFESAQAEFTRAARAATIEALNDLRGLSQKHEAEMKARLQKALEPVLEENLLGLREKATETSRQFADEIDNYSRSHLEFVGGAISELARGLGKKARD